VRPIRDFDRKLQHGAVANREIGTAVVGEELVDENRGPWFGTGHHDE
jgi:hypothetical protein